jgi:hypothetical protein
MSATATTVDSSEVRASLAKLARESDDLTTSFRIIGGVIVADARVRAPRRSGALASSIHASTRRTSVTVSSQLVYSGVQEFGWRRRNIRAQPYLRPAADSKATLAAVEITRQINRIINLVGLG